MKKWLPSLSLVFAVMGTGLLVIGQLGFLEGNVPNNIGVKDGRLMPPSDTPNSVSSQTRLYPNHPQRDYADIPPLDFSGYGATAMARLADMVQKMDRTVVVKRGPEYIYAQCNTPLLKFTDDLEFWLDQTHKVIQVRSASRLGQKDFGTNRARVESIRARFSH
jgi:uncharacterized protein (DUF1499 family)